MPSTLPSALAAAACGRLRASPPAVPAATVVVMRWSAAGDIVLTLPAVHALANAWPDARIVYATHARFAPLLRAEAAISEVLPLAAGESLMSLHRRVAATGAEALLDLHGKLRGRALFWAHLGGRRARAGGRRVATRLAHAWGGARAHTGAPPALVFHAAASQLVGRPLPAAGLVLSVHPDDRRAARRHLAEAPAPGHRGRRIGIAPGAAWPTKMWPVAHFAALAARLAAAGHRVVLTGSPAEVPLCQAIARAVPAAQALAGAGDLGLLAGIIDGCDAFVANDSGPMHIARALGVPTLALFGCTDPAQFDLAGHGLAHLGLDCAPCSFYGERHCPRGHHRCLGEMSVELVWRTLAPLLAGGRRRPPPAF